MSTISRNTAEQILLKHKVLFQINPRRRRFHLPLPVACIRGKYGPYSKIHGIEFVFRPRCRTEKHVFIPF